MELQERIEAVRASGRRHMPKSLQQEIVRYVAEQKRRGRSVRETVDALGVSEERLSYWRKQIAARTLVPFRPVVVAAEPAPRIKEIVLELGSRARVRGLDMNQLGELLRALG